MDLLYQNEQKINYENLSKSKLFSIEKRCRTLKYLLDNTNLIWYTNEKCCYYEFENLISKWNLLYKLANKKGIRVELAITKQNKEYVCWIQKNINGTNIKFNPLYLSENNILSFLKIFATVGVFNNLGEYIWI